MSIGIKEIIRGKNILLIPIYSMRSYATGKYNLMADGNVSRIISKLAESEFIKATILIPENVDNFDELKLLVGRTIGLDRVTFIPCNAYGHNAGETRKEVNKFVTFFAENDVDLLGFDHVLIEPNLFTMFLIGSGISLNKLIFWCPVSATTGFTPSFIQDYAETDKIIAQNIIVAAATDSQVKYLGGRSFVDEGFYNPKIFDYKTIFFPFRLSDPCYHAEEFKKCVDELKGKYNFKVLYTDPNESGLFDDESVFVKVPSQKEVYTQILKSKPIIPYLENSDDVLHISMFEFFYYGCELIMMQNQTNLCPTAIEISDISQLKVALEEKLKSL